MHEADMPVDRRTVVAGTGAAIVGLGLFAAGCGSSDSSSGGGTAAGAAPAAAGIRLGPTTDVPVGGGKIFTDQKVVVTQATAGTFVGLSAVCTHQGCVVATIADGTINCPCHGSKYHLDGTVANGPAAKPLPAVSVTATGGQLAVG